MGPASRFACAGRRPVELVCRHCERSEAIHGTSTTKLDCFAALAMTGVATAGKHTQLSFPDVQLHIVDAPLGAGPQSITTEGGYRFRTRRCASPRNDGVSTASSQTTSCGYGSRIALRLCGTTGVDLSCRHCERSEAIHGTSAT